MYVDGYTTKRNILATDATQRNAHLPPSLEGNLLNGIDVQEPVQVALEKKKKRTSESATAGVG